ncbi:MAG: NAD(P)H-binding protein [Nocardia sp.]|nr:NAD(P)H-binding protein [Nocardia sp.]
MRIFVTGATGAIGVPVVSALAAAGHAVTALVRTPDKAARAAAAGATPVTVSLFDRAGLCDAFAAHDAVVNLASALPSTFMFPFYRSWRECARIRSEGSAAVVDAACAANVTVLVQESVSMIYRDGGSRWLDESAPVEYYRISAGNHAAEASARRFTEAGGTGIVLRFGLFHGPTATHSLEMLRAARSGVAPMFGSPDAYISSIHLDDAAAAVVSVLTAPAGVYNAVDDEPLTHRDYADALAIAVGQRRYVRIPGRAALLCGDRLTSLTRSLRVSNARLRETGWTPQYLSAREGLAATWTRRESTTSPA